MQTHQLITMSHSAHCFIKPSVMASGEKPFENAAAQVTAQYNELHRLF